MWKFSILLLLFSWLALNSAVLAFSINKDNNQAGTTTSMLDLDDDLLKTTLFLNLNAINLQGCILKDNETIYKFSPIATFKQVTLENPLRPPRA